MFRAIGLEEKKEVDSRLSTIFATGNMMHLKWQMAGLTEGWLSEAEVVADRDDLSFGGTLDGINWDGSGLEYKSINDRGYNMVTSAGEPKQMHIDQVHGYFILRDDIDRFSVIYENKNTGDWREFLVRRDDKKVDEITKELLIINEHISGEKLPPVLRKCQERDGAEYRNCPFKDECLGMKKWPTTK